MMSRTLLLSIAILAAIAVGCKRPGGSSTTEPANDPPPATGNDSTEPVGVLQLREIALKWEHPQANRAALTEQYLGKWWVVDFAAAKLGGGAPISVEPEYILWRDAPADEWVQTRFYFKDRKALAKLGYPWRLKVKGYCKDAYTFTDCEVVPLTEAEAKDYARKDDKLARTQAVSIKLREAREKLRICEDLIRSYSHGSGPMGTLKPDEVKRLEDRKAEKIQLDKDIATLQAQLKKIEAE